MAVRPYWKGYLKLSLVTCAVTLSPATTEGERVRFHTINRKTGDRIYTKYIDSGSGRTVEDDDQVKAYEKAEDEYVILEDEELDAVQLESARTIDIDVVEADKGKPKSKKGEDDEDDLARQLRVHISQLAREPDASAASFN